MATTQYLGDKEIFEPGSYANTDSGIQAEPASATYGNVLIIDTGSGAGFGAGSGIIGDLKGGKEAISFYPSQSAFGKAINGGIFGLLAKPLFQPSRQRSVKGVNGVYFIKAAETAAAGLNLSFGTGTPSIAELRVRNEGPCGNGTLLGGELTRGYATRMRKAPQDPSLYILDFYRGTFSGLNANGEPYNNILEANCKPRFLFSSVAFNKTGTLYNWMRKNREFNEEFFLASAGADITVTNTDLTNNLSYKLFTGGSESYTTEALTEVLDSIADLDYSFILSDQAGQDATSVTNTQYLEHLQNEAVHQKFMVVAGGSTRDEKDTSVEAARYFDSNSVVVVHGGVGISRGATSGFALYGAIYKAALVVGRICGVSPQTPVTFKDLDYNYEVHELKAKDRKYFLDNGVLHTKKDGGAFIVNEGINSLQRNTDVINEETGQSHLISVERISAQLNKEIVLRATEVFLKAASGPNRSTVSAEIYKTWLNNELSSKVAKPEEGIDGLILYFDRVVVVEDQDALRSNYRFEPNFEVNKILNTGHIIDRS